MVYDVCIMPSLCPTVTVVTQTSPLVQCKPWEKSVRGTCVCKMPFECRYVYSTYHQFCHVTFYKLDWFDSLVLCVTVFHDDFLISSSLEVCATSAGRRKSVLLNVCKMHALQCMGKNQIIAEDSTCKWPVGNRSCTNCHMWETCDGRDFKKLQQPLTACSICHLYSSHSSPQHSFRSNQWVSL